VFSRTSISQFQYTASLQSVRDVPKIVQSSPGPS
jgi:hypothetical protein